MADGARANSSAQLVFGFVAGFLATLIFHQLTLALLWGIGVAPSGPFPMAPTRPFGVPAIFSLAFWGGVWGILFALVQRSFPRGGAYWVAAFLWRDLAFARRPHGGFTAQGTPDGWRLASAFAADGILDQRSLGYRHRAHSQTSNELVKRIAQGLRLICQIALEWLCR